MNVIPNSRLRTANTPSMHTTTKPSITTNRPRFFAAATAIACCSSFAVVLSPSAVAQTAAPAGPLAITCVANSCHLYAAEGTANIGTTAAPLNVSVRSYKATATGAATAVGPTLVAEAGVVTITLHNALASPTTLVLPAGTGNVTVNAPAAGDSGATALTLAAGTYLYESTNPRDVALGMIGALIVKPAGSATTAYAGKAAFTDEASLVLSEIDPTLTPANAATFNMRNWRPTHQMINGKKAPATAPIPTAVGNSVLLRYVNGGLINHTMGVLGARQLVIGRDARPMNHNESLVAPTIRPGQTLDAIVVMPSSANVAIYDTSTNAGMQTTLRSSGAGTGGTGGTTTTTISTTPPAVTAMTVTPSTIGATETAALSGTITGNGTSIDSYRWAIDAAPATEVAVTPAAQITVSGISLTGLAGGNHTISLAGHSAAGWGASTTRNLLVDNVGPVLSGFAANITNGAINLSFSASESTTGNANVTAAEWNIRLATDPVPVTFSGTALVVSSPAPTVNVAGSPTVPASITADGQYVVSVRAQDARGNWSTAPSTATVVIDQSGPIVVAGSAFTDPVATNGVQASPQAPGGSVAVKAKLTDTLSNVVQAEAFLRTAAPAVNLFGTGSAGATNGVFDALTEDVTMLLPLSGLPAAPFNGTATYWVHGKDAAGNWGPFTAVPMVVDRTIPTISAAAANAVTVGATSTTLSITSTDPLSNAVASGVKRAEWFEGATPAVGAGTSVATIGGAITIAPASVGTHTIGIRVLDFAGNWSAVFSTTYVVTAPNLVFKDPFIAGTSLSSVWSSATGAGTVNAAGQMSNTAVGQFVTDTTPVAEPTYLAQFDIVPGSLRSTNATSLEIFSGYSADIPSAATRIFRLQYRRNPNAAAGVPQVRLGVRGTGNTETFGAWVALPGGAALSTVRIDWTSGTAAAVTLRFGAAGTIATTTTTNTSSWRVQSVRLGLDSVGVVAAGTGPLLTDNFQSARVSFPA
jgi:hypothetical protein